MTQKQQVQYITGNVDAQLSDSLRGRVAYNNSWSRTKGLLPALNGTDPARHQLRQDVDVPELLGLGQPGLGRVAEAVLRRPRRLLHVRPARHQRDRCSRSIASATTSNVGFLDVPASLQQPARASRASRRTRKVDARPADARVLPGRRHLYAKAGGEHQFKFGVQARPRRQRRAQRRVAATASRSAGTPPLSTASVSAAPTATTRFAATASTRSRASSPKANIHTTNIGLFIQDAWTIGNKLTVNAGLRTERERVPTYTTGADIPEFGIEFGVQGQAGAARRLRLRHQRRRQVEGVRFVGRVLRHLQARAAARIVRRRQVARLLLHARHVRLAEPPGRLGNCPPACPGTLISGPIDFRHPSFGSDSIRARTSSRCGSRKRPSASITSSNDVVAVGVRYVHKQIDRAIEDTGSLDAGRQRNLHHRQPRRRPDRARVDQSR